MQSLGLSEYLIETVDSEPFSNKLSLAIAAEFRRADFEAKDNGHHITVSDCFNRSGPVEVACIYVEEEILWIKAIAARWWFHDNDDDLRFNLFWTVVDGLKRSAFKEFITANKFHEGTVGALPSPEYRDAGFMEAFKAGLLKDYFGVPSGYLTFQEGETEDTPEADSEPETEQLFLFPLEESDRHA